MLRELRAARGSYSVGWMQLLKGISSKPNALFCFFEGDDCKYYGWRIDTFSNAIEWIPIVANGRKNVLRLLTLAAGDPAKYKRAFFFVDRDFDQRVDLPQDDHLYVTPTYSVENFYLTDNAFKKILRDEFGVTPLDNRDERCFDRLLSLYVACRSSFFSACRMATCWLAAHRARERAAPGTVNVQIDALRFQSIISIELAGCAAAYDLAALNATHPNEPPLDVADLDAQGAVLDVDPTSTYRGKFLVLFLRSFLQKLKDDCATANPAFAIAGLSPKIVVSERNFLSDLTQYADTPGCLRQFLSKMPTSP